MFWSFRLTGVASFTLEAVLLKGDRVIASAARLWLLETDGDVTGLKERFLAKRKLALLLSFLREVAVFF